MVFLSHWTFPSAVDGLATFSPQFLALADMADEELPYEYQLDKIASRVNKCRADGTPLEMFLMPTFFKYFPVAMEPGVLTDVRWNDISGLFTRSLVLPMTYMDNEVLLAMSHQSVWETDSPESCYPRHSLVVVKIYSSAPVYALVTVYVPAAQERLHFLKVLTGLHQFQMDVAALVYMPKSCIYMPEPSSGDHYTLLPLTGDKDICIGALSSFAAAKLTVASKHCSRDMGVHLKLPPNFDLQLDGDDLITEPALRRGQFGKMLTLLFAATTDVRC